MTVSMVARAFYVLVVALLLLGTAIAYLRARGRARRRGVALRAFIQEGAAQAMRQRRRTRAFVSDVSDFQSGEGRSSAPWPDAGSPNCSEPARRLLTHTLMIVACTPDPSAPQAVEDDADTTPYQSLPPSPAAPQPVALRVTAAQALRLIDKEAPDPSETLADSWPAVRATAAAAALLVLFGITGRATIPRRAPLAPQKAHAALVPAAEVAHA